MKGTEETIVFQWVKWTDGGREGDGVEGHVHVRRSQVLEVRLTLSPSHRIH